MKQEAPSTGLLLRASLFLMWGYAGLTVLSALAVFHGKCLIQYRFHQRLSFPVWCALQPVPAMYNFENFCTIVGYEGTKEISRREVWVNHHPMRLIYEDRFHNPAAESAMVYHFTSRAGANSFESFYRLERKEAQTLRLISQ